ncbi:sensor histidine kinase [Mucilaginibacter sp. 3215]|uniref:sensor histidine kinase n=1 Tax=Mucilaginibacter sp. 3215 TaxID=3373912 RepID=UPI003D1E84C6
MASADLTGLVLTTTLIFTLAIVFIVLYIMNYNQRKRKHVEEKERMKQEFDREIVKTELEVMEHTMQTIGSDLHDNIGQLLSLTSFTLNSVSLHEPLRAREKIDSAIELTRRSIREMRQLGKLLQGEQLLAQGLESAIVQEMQWLERSGQFHVSYHITAGFPAEVHPEIDLVVFRVLQEILNNIIKHAQASLIELQLDRKEGNLLMSVSDNGIGFDPQTECGINNGMGLRNICKRTSLIGGLTQIESVPARGTTIKIQIPYN